MNEQRDVVPAPPEWKGLFGRSYEHWMLLAFAFVGVAALVVLGAFVDPDPRGFGTHEKLGLPSCKPMDWWGVPCPGCGVTTSISLAAHGHPWASFTNQPFGFVIALLIPVFATWCVVNHFRGHDLHTDISKRSVTRLGIGLAAVMVAAWSYKLALVRHWVG